MLKQTIAGQTLLISLKSWRYILCLSFMAYLLTEIILLYDLAAIAACISLFAGLITAFYCWRLWLDEQFFALLYQNNADIDAFDAAIKTLWSKELKSRTLEQRWSATGSLIYRAWLFVILQ